MIIIVATVCPIVASAEQRQALEKRTNLYTMAPEKLNVMIGNLIHGCPTIKVNHVEREYLQTLEQDNENAAHAEFAKSKTKVRVNMIIGLLSNAPANSGSVSSVYPCWGFGLRHTVLHIDFKILPLGCTGAVGGHSAHLRPCLAICGGFQHQLRASKRAPVTSTLRTVMLPFSSMALIL